MAEPVDVESMMLRNYEAYAQRDLVVIDDLAHDDMVMHVPGSHPLSGDHVGREAAWSYLGKVAEVSGGAGGFQLTGLTSDDQGHGVALLVGTIRDFVRPVVHIWRVQDGRFAEFWEQNFDQAAEDAFWNAALP